MPQNENPQVSRVAVKTPPFWHEEPELWFAQLEGQFTLSGITQDETKYAHVLSQIDTRNAREVKDIITNPPAQDKYLAIKTALIQRLSVSQEQRIRQLLEHEELGDRKPSQFLRHLQTLAGSSITEQLLRTLWLGRLPSQMQVILATRTQDRLEDVAKQADRIQEVTGRSIAEVATSANSNQSMEEQIRQLTRQVTALSRRLEKASSSRNRNRSKSRDRKKDGPCYYHSKYGNDAKKCVQPCSFQQPKERGSH